MAGRKSELLARSSAPGFWEDPAGSHALFDEVYRLDGVLASLTELENKVRAEVELVARHRHSDRDLATLDGRLDALDSRYQHVAFLVGCRDSQALGDALVTLSLSAHQGVGLDAVPLLGACTRISPPIAGWKSKCSTTACATIPPRTRLR